MNDTHKEVLSKEDYITAVKKVTGGDVLEQKLLLAAGKSVIFFANVGWGGTSKLTAF